MFGLTRSELARLPLRLPLQDRRPRDVPTCHFDLAEHCSGARSHDAVRLPVAVWRVLALLDVAHVWRGPLSALLAPAGFHLGHDHHPRPHRGRTAAGTREPWRALTT
jgi:hypothetical protein